MLPRGKIDIGWSDLLFGLRRSVRPGDREVTRRRVEQFWAPEGNAFACLSVRTGFDALLQALAYPPGSEILLSALTIRDMAKIIQEHGLVPIPVDLDMATLSIATDRLERARTERTKAILIAHVFGSRMPLDEVVAFARTHGLLVIEDCAQAYAGNDYRGHPEVDVALFSFGPIKTNTALAGALLHFRDRALLERVRAIEATYPVQESSRFRRRVLKYCGLKLLSYPIVFGLFVRACRLAGKTHDEVISAALRGFPGPDLLVKLRHQPSELLLALLERRLRTFDRRRIERRTAAARAAIAAMPRVERPGARAPLHTHWVFPVLSKAPDALMRRLWAAGFDATRGASSLYVVPTPPDRPEVAPTAADAAMRDLLYLPVYAGAPTAAIERLARLTAETEAGTILAATPDAAAGAPAAASQ